MCVFSYIMLAIITLCISDLQALDDLLMFYNECQEHGLEQYITCLLFVLDGLCIFDVHFKMHVMTKRNPKIFYFLWMKCFVIKLHLVPI